MTDRRLTFAYVNGEGELFEDPAGSLVDWDTYEALRQRFERACARITELESAAETAGDWRSMEELSATVEPPTFVLIAERKPDDSYVVGEARWFGDQGWRWAGNDPTDHWGREVYPERWMPLPAPPGSRVKTSAEPAPVCRCDKPEPALIDHGMASLCEKCYRLIESPKSRIEKQEPLT